MAFSIELLSDAILDPATGTEARYGDITLDDFQERFVALTTFWKAVDYERHWRTALQRIVDGARSSCLITSLHSPQESHILFWWPMYRVDDQVLVQNGILFLDKLSTPFDPTNPFTYVPPRRAETTARRCLNGKCW
jgi:hypothetical protein